VTDTARLLLTAAILSGSAIGVYAWRLSRTDPMTPERLIGELQLAQWAALLLAATGAVSMGLAVGAESRPWVNVDAAVGIGFVALAAVVLKREPRDALLWAAAGFLVHALTDIAHRPGLLPSDLAPRWYMLGSAIYDACIAAAIYLARRR